MLLQKNSKTSSFSEETRSSQRRSTKLVQTHLSTVRLGHCMFFKQKKDATCWDSSNIRIMNGWIGWEIQNVRLATNVFFPSTEIHCVASPIQTMSLDLEPHGHQISELFRLDDDSKSFPEETMDYITFQKHGNVSGSLCRCKKNSIQLMAGFPKNPWDLLPTGPSHGTVNVP